MLGVRRASVSIVAGTLRRAGLIEYRRGLIRIIDVESLAVRPVSAMTRCNSMTSGCSSNDAP
jgi:hypothetical protein